MALEFDGSGCIRYVFDVGSGPRVMSHDPTVECRPINDNHWHDVSVGRVTVGQHVLRVDNWTVTDVLPDSRSVYYDLSGDDLYIGGLSRQAFITGQFVKQVLSRDGFQGCLMSVHLDGSPWSLSRSRVQVLDEYQDVVKEGCAGGWLRSWNTLVYCSFQCSFNVHTKISFIYLSLDIGYVLTLRTKNSALLSTTGFVYFFITKIIQ